MNLALLDRKQLEDILLEPPAVETSELHCSEDAALAYLPEGGSERHTRVRHVLAAAHELLVRAANCYVVGRSLLNSPDLVKDYLKVHFAGAERETFVVVYLDVQLRVIATEELFQGTLTQTSVYPREVVKRALHFNASALVVSHCHPASGQAEPSRADEYLTKTLKDALNLVDVRLMDHIVVGGNSTVSFAERGML